MKPRRRAKAKAKGDKDKVKEEDEFIRRAEALFNEAPKGERVVLNIDQMKAWRASAQMKEWRQTLVERRRGSDPDVSKAKSKVDEDEDEDEDEESEVEKKKRERDEGLVDPMMLVRALVLFFAAVARVVNTTHRSYILAGLFVSAAAVILNFALLSKSSKILKKAMESSNSMFIVFFELADHLTTNRPPADPLKHFYLGICAALIFFSLTSPKARNAAATARSRSRNKRSHGSRNLAARKFEKRRTRWR
jgi:hypothetical protein